jgi:FlaA1/EpsC-like NDP-sugar epimerase
MALQNYGNHTRYLPMWHFVTSTALLALVIGSIRYLLVAAEEERYNASLIVLCSLILCSIFWYARVFALKAQDRAIRAEENFRHYLLTGKPFPAGIKTSQIVALRFASDDELAPLTQLALQQNLTSKAIKQAIQNWRADYRRV